MGKKERKCGNETEVFVQYNGNKTTYIINVRKKYKVKRIFQERFMLGKKLMTAIHRGLGDTKAGL